MSEMRWENLDAVFAELEREVTAVVRGITVEVWDGVLKKTPQFYGRLAASWDYTVGSPQFVDRSDEVKDAGLGEGPRQAFYRGHPAAIAVANAANFGQERFFKLGDTVYISNGADHGEGAYAGWAEDAGSLLRLFNRPGKAVGRSIDAAAKKYAQGVSKKDAARLANLSIG